MSETTSVEAARYVLAFPAPLPVLELYGKARAACWKDYNFQLYPGKFGPHITVKSPFDLSPSDERRFFTRLDKLQRKGVLSMLPAQFGAIGRFFEPEDVVYLETGGEELQGMVGCLLDELEDVGVKRREFDGQSLHITLSKGERAELQDLAFGTCTDVCSGKYRPRVGMLTELLLLDRHTKAVAKSWTLTRH